MTTWTKLWTNNWNVDIDTLNSAEVQAYLFADGGIRDTVISLYEQGKMADLTAIYLNDRKSRQRYFLDQATVDEWDAYVKNRITQYNLDSYYIGSTIEDANLVT